MSGEETEQETGTCTRCGRVAELYWADSSYVGELMGTGYVCADCLLALTGEKTNGE